MWKRFANGASPPILHKEREQRCASLLAAHRATGHQDVLRLLHRSGELLEDFRYYATWKDRSFNKTVDGGREWTYWYPPSPGRTNGP